MPTLVNTTQRLINTHDMTPLPPGTPTVISDEAMAHADIQQALADGHLVNPEGIIDATKRKEEEAKSDQPSPVFNTGPQAETKTKPAPNQQTNTQRTGTTKNE